MIARDKVPSNTEVLTSADFSHDRSTSFLEGLSQYLPGVFIGDQTGNPFQRDVNYRGFVASPVQGTPQGLAVYQNGVRINPGRVGSCHQPQPARRERHRHC